MIAPKNTVVTTLALLGIGILAVVAVLILSFRMLNSPSSRITDPDSETDEVSGFPTPPTEYYPNPNLRDPDLDDPVNRNTDF